MPISTIFSHYRHALLVLVLGLWAACAWSPAAASTPPAVPPATADAKAPADTSSPELLQAQIRLQDAQRRIKAAKDLLKNGNAELAAIKAALASKPPQLVLDGVDTPTLETMRQQILVESQAAEATTQTRRDALNAAESVNLVQPLPEPPTLAASAPLEQQALASAQAAASTAENEAYTLEVSSQPIALQLARAKLELAQSAQQSLQDRLRAIDQRLDAARLKAARATLLDTSATQIYAAYPALQEFAASNTELAQALIKLTERLASLTQEREQITQHTAEMKEEMAALVRQLEQFGFGPIMGNLLLEKRSTLPTTNRLQRQSQDNRALLEALQTVEVRLSQERQTLRDPQALINKLLGSLDAQTQKVMQQDVEKMVEARQTIFTNIQEIKSPILQAVAGIEYALEAQQRTVKAFNAFIAQNLLWLPNERPVWSHSLATHWSGLQASVEALKIDSLPGALREAMQAYALQTLLVIGLLLLLWGLRPRLLARLQAIVDAASLPHFNVWRSAVRSLVLASLLALPVPLVLLGLGLLLNTTNLPLHSVVANNLISAAFVWLNAGLFLVLARPGGVTEKMFGWSPRALVALRSAFYLFIYVAIPLDVLASTSLELAGTLHDDAGGGQFLLILLLILLAFIFGRLLRPGGAFIRHWQAAHAAHWLNRHITSVFAVAVGMPLFFALMTADGYTYSAGVLTGTYASSLWVMLALILLSGFAKMSLQRAYQRIARLRRQREQQDAALSPELADDETDAPPSVEEARALDMSQIATQSRKLLSFSLGLAFVFAMYFVWAPVLPALSLLDKVNLWSLSQVVNGSTISSAVSLGDALLTGVSLLVLWVAARNLPGVMGIMLEQWTTHEAGTRYAITTIVRYIIISAGIVILLGGLGVQWSQLQWLVAALGVGLGFGLQEIFANFVSGIIILLERPVRVGDLVTIGTQTGTIRRIHMRATVLEDFDRKEIVVPNKMLITREVTNWTLSDSTTRVLVDIGVAYGSDTRKVESLLLKAAHSVPRLQTEPAPLVWFMGFGDSALNFRVRAFVAEADIKLGVTSELNYEIEKILREQGISIPFPQRDVHVSGLDELSAALKNNLSAPPTAPHIDQGATA
ncbi:MAG: mechanosensitive ion channel [Halothiobacillaceae bacterium]|nr:mechanosensitive ion channel [Halothiobacillaceae bacterium]